jgi:hypothetical protein
MAVGSQIGFDLAESDLRRPKYERMKEHFMRELRSHRLKPGKSLPKELDLAHTFNGKRSRSSSGRVWWTGSAGKERSSARMCTAG